MQTESSLKHLSRKASSHVYIDWRSRDFHRLIASRISSDPSLLEVARNNIRRWRELARGRKKEPYYLSAWEKELEKGVEHVLSFMVDDSEYATQLRQSSPFAGIISQRERIQFFREWNDKHRPKL